MKGEYGSQTYTSSVLQAYKMALPVTPEDKSLYKCEECGFTDTHKNNFKQQDENNYKCNFCTVKFLDKGTIFNSGYGVRFIYACLHSRALVSVEFQIFIWSTTNFSFLLCMPYMYFVSFPS